MKNPIHYNDRLGEYYVWVSIWGIKYMKYFKSPENAMQHVRDNPQRCFELTDRSPTGILDDWITDAKNISITRQSAEQDPRISSDNNRNELVQDKVSKNRLVYGVDCFAIIITAPLLKVIGVGGALPTVIIGGACIYFSMLATNAISQSAISKIAKVASYLFLVLSYFVLSILFFMLADVIHDGVT